MGGHVDQFGAVQENVGTLTVAFEQVPRVEPEQRITLQRHDGGVWHVIARYGFVEIPLLQATLSEATHRGCPVVPQEAVFVGGRDEVVRPRRDGEDYASSQPRLAGWRRRVFGVMYRNAVHLVDRFDLPADRYVQIGRQVAL